MFSVGLSNCWNGEVVLECPVCNIIYYDGATVIWYGTNLFSFDLRAWLRSWVPFNPTGFVNKLTQ